ncbi:MAG TPA: hypothetical protein VKF32_02140 [Thermoanaerobaculia bacterium]|nr:hypothetical protein [Thermoanaerobaculia bacterium]
MRPLSCDRLRTSLPSGRRQIFTAPSTLAVARKRESGLKATALVIAAWARNV